ncbi:MAG: hypothetical protein MRY83_08510 [Flavobacteriales bacterium]|nr:hypothetical protein [Flavobacteriales bacterium]
MTETGKTYKRLINNLLILGSLGVLLVASCARPDPPRAVVIVTNEDGKTLSGAIVKLDCTPGQQAPNQFKCREEVDFGSETDASGRVEFLLKLPAVLRAQVAWAGKNDTGAYVLLEGDGFIEFKEDEVTEETIIVYP